MWSEMENMSKEERRKKLQPRTSVRKDAACTKTWSSNIFLYPDSTLIFVSGKLRRRTEARVQRESPQVSVDSFDWDSKLGFCLLRDFTW